MTAQMRTSITTVLLWSWIVLLGTSFGAGIYEHRVVTPRWLAKSADGQREWRAAAAREDDVGLQVWAFVSTGLTAHLQSERELKAFDCQCRRWCGRHVTRAAMDQGAPPGGSAQSRHAVATHRS
jgi:hypothetical protein